MIALLKRLYCPVAVPQGATGIGSGVTVAAFAALVVALALHLMLPLWAVLTALIVTQMSVGRSLKATRDYLFGTVGGAIYGAAITVLIPHSSEAGLLALLVLAIAPLAFIAAINPSLNAATVTAVIVLLVPTMNHANPLDSAIDRVLEVLVGAVCGLLASFFVLPSRAHSQLRASAARTLELIAAALSELLAGLTRGRDNDALHAVQDGIGAAMAGLNATGAEAERERAAHLSSGPDTGPLLRTVLRLRHDLVMIGRATVVPLPADVQARLAAPLARVSETMAAYLRAIAAALRTRRRRARDLAGAGRAAGLRRRSRGGAGRRPDPRLARRRRGAIFRAGIFAGADAAEPEGPGALRGGMGRGAGDRGARCRRISPAGRAVQRATCRSIAGTMSR